MRYIIHSMPQLTQHFSKYYFSETVKDINLKFEILKFSDFSHSEMVKTIIRDDRLPMHVSHVQLFDFARGNKHN